MENTDKQAEEFLKIAHQFKLGMLVTEAFHPKTVGLSHLAQTDIPKAISMLQVLDVDLLDFLGHKFDAADTRSIIASFKQTLSEGHTIFLCGCGATGRLSSAIETLWRQQWNASRTPASDKLKFQVVGFMAGGDVALIKAVEDFEDHTEFAAQQLEDLGYREGDLLVASTESGVTPWVIGAANHAAEKAKTGKYPKPFFVYCNPDEILIENVERTKEVILNENIMKLNVCVGPMAVTGSTRMQASTAVMYLLGLCLFLSYKSIENPELDPTAAAQAEIASFKDFLAKADLSGLAAFTEAESRLYAEGNYIFYETSPNYAITVLTDTTERSPTFSLYPFENAADSLPAKQTRHSLCHLLLAEDRKVDIENYREHSRDGWKKMLAGREVRPLEGKAWEKYKGIVSKERIYEHVFTKEIVELRKKYCREHSVHKVLKIDKTDSKLVLTLRDVNAEPYLKFALDISVLKGNALLEHTLLKIILNIQSTLVMGRMKRYESNLMTYVRPSNNKLIDRSIRYVMHLLKQQKEKDHNKVTYKDVCYELFRQMPLTSADEPIVLNTFKAIMQKIQ